MPKFVVVVDHPTDNVIHESSSKRQFQALVRLSQAMAQFAGKIKRATSMTVNRAAVQATTTATLASVLAADTYIIGGNTFTAVTGAAGNNQFDRSGTDNQTATNLAAAINGSTTANVNRNFKAVALANVVTVTVNVPGTLGNCLSAVSSNAARIAIPGGGTSASFGSGGASVAGAETQVVYTLG